MATRNGASGGHGMRQTRCVRRACTGHVRRHSFFFYPYRPALRRLLLPLSSCRGRSRSKKRRRGARAREVRERARSRVTILTVSRSCIGGATRENVVGGAGPGPSELSVCLSVCLLSGAKEHSVRAFADACSRLLDGDTTAPRGRVPVETACKKLFVVKRSMFLQFTDCSLPPPSSSRRM